MKNDSVRAEMVYVKRQGEDKTLVNTPKNKLISSPIHPGFDSLVR
jgi:hypothetical protein